MIIELPTIRELSRMKNNSENQNRTSTTYTKTYSYFLISMECQPVELYPNISWIYNWKRLKVKSRSGYELKIKE